MRRFDLDTAWRDAMGLLKGHLSLLAIIAGVFFFLPYVLVMVAYPEFGALSGAESEADAAARFAALEAWVAGHWYVVAALLVAQTVGLIAMLALLRRRDRPTVGEALASGVAVLPSYILANLIIGVAMLVSLILVTVPATFLGEGVAAILLLGWLVGMALVFARLSLVSPILAIEGVRNPVAAITRAWRLTRGATWRLTAFYLLLGIAVLVVTMVISLLSSLLLALLGEAAAQIGAALTGGLLNAVAAVLAVCVMAAAHTQFRRLAEGGDSER